MIGIFTNLWIFIGFWVCFDKSSNLDTTPVRGQGNNGLVLNKHGLATLLNPVGGVKGRISPDYLQ
jgi:hypothetical protein